MLGIFNWRQDFLDHFYPIAEPLYKLTAGKKKTALVELEEPHIKAIKELIKLAQQKATLTLPRFDSEAPAFELECDASFLMNIRLIRVWMIQCCLVTVRS